MKTKNIASIAFLTTSSVFAGGIVQNKGSSQNSLLSFFEISSLPFQATDEASRGSLMDSGEMKLAVAQATPDAVAVLQGEEPGTFFRQAASKIEAAYGEKFDSFEEAALVILSLAAE